MAFQMCQSCDKSCLNFTQSEIKCQQKLPKLSDQVRQTTKDRKSTRLNSSHIATSRMPSSA